MALGPKRKGESTADRIYALAKLCFAKIVSESSYGEPFSDWYIKLPDRIIEVMYNYGGRSQNVIISVRSDKLHCWTHYELENEGDYFSEWFENDFVQCIKSFAELGSGA